MKPLRQRFKPPPPESRYDSRLARREREVIRGTTYRASIGIEFGSSGTCEDRSRCYLLRLPDGQPPDPAAFSEAGSLWQPEGPAYCGGSGEPSAASDRGGGRPRCGSCGSARPNGVGCGSRRRLARLGRRLGARRVSPWDPVRGCRRPRGRRNGRVGYHSPPRRARHRCGLALGRGAVRRVVRGRKLGPAH